MSHDKLGQIDNAHVVIADMSENNVLDDKCLRLCEKHSIAVDFAKNGIKVDVENDLIPKKYPTFMERKDKKSYKSNKIIGQLYERIKEIYDEAIPEYQPKGPIEKYQDFIETASILFEEYKTEITSLLNQFGLESEIEFLIGQPINLNIFQKTGIKPEDLKETLTNISNNLIEKYQQKFHENASFQFALALYHVSHTHKPPFRAFPWLICTQYLSAALIK